MPSPAPLEQLAAEVASWVRESRYTVAFTGAGISTESGIPDFRSPGGVWATSQPVYYNDFLRSAAARHEYWRQKAASHAHFVEAQPNAAHQVLSRWQQSGWLKTLITQNIDGLHQEAGSSGVLELHGTARSVTCLDCGAAFDPGPLVEEFLSEDRVPDCPACTRGKLKHATVSFGQQLPVDVLEAAAQASQECDLFFALGSSLVVEPAASLPVIARNSGARLVIVNRDETHLDGLADCAVHATLGEFMTMVDQLVNETG